MSRPVIPQAIVGAGAIAWLFYTWTGHWADMTPAMMIATGLALGGTVAAAFVGNAPRVRLRLAIVAAMLAGNAAFAGLRAAEHWPFVWDAMPSRGYAAFLAAAALTTSIGLLFRQLWARWVALAFGVAGALGGALNSIGMRTWRDETSWLAAIGVIGCATVFIQLSHGAVRDHFDRGGQSVWAAKDRLVRSARWAAITSAAAGAMLLLYALGAHVVPQTETSALVLAPVLMLGSGLVVARRGAGLLLLGAGGLGLLAQSAMTLADVAPESRMNAAYYVMFWAPAGIIAVAAAVIALRRSR